LNDAMSPVPEPPISPLPAGLDFPRLAEAGIRELASKGMQVRETASRL